MDKTLVILLQLNHFQIVQIEDAILQCCAIFELNLHVTVEMKIYSPIRNIQPSCMTVIEPMTTQLQN